MIAVQAFPKNNYCEQCQQDTSHVRVVMQNIIDNDIPTYSYPNETSIKLVCETCEIITWE